MWDSTVQVGNKEVVDSGYVTAFGDDIIEISLEHSLAHNNSGDDPLTFLFEFRDNGQEPEIESTVLNDKRIKYIIYNHRSGATVGGYTPPIGPVDPLDVGTLSYRRLYLNFRVSSRGTEGLSSQANDFYYTFYLGEEVNESEIEQMRED